MNTRTHGLRSRGWGTWSLTLLASGFAVGTATVAYCMLRPVPPNGVGRLGTLALLYPLHVLALSLVGLGLALVASRGGARLAARLCICTILLIAILGIAPTTALMWQARTLNVSLSLASYLAHALHVNRGGPDLERTVVYGIAKDGTKLELDVWRTGRPNSGPLRPAVVIIHGGGWTNGNRSMHPDWDRWLNGLGYEVFDIEYRMPPVGRWSDEVGDVKTALGWVAVHAADYHVDPTRISLMGYSAGGNLAMLAAYSMGHEPWPPSTDVHPVAVRSIINFYGPTDMALLYRMSPAPEYTDSFVRYTGGTLEDVPERYRRLSPLSYIDAKAPPTITLHGTRDRLVSHEHALLLDQALREASVPHEMVLLAFSDHSFDVNWGGFATQIARAKIRAFLEHHS